MNTEEIWNRHHNEISRFIRSKVKDADVAKDILQETFITVHTKRHQVRDESKLKSWIYQVSRNQILLHFRKERQNLPSHVPEVIDPITDPNLPSDKLLICMNSFIKAMPQKYREPLQLVGFSNVKQLDLPGILKISYSGAKSRFQRAKRLLRKKLEKCCTIAADRYGNVLEAECLGKCACEG
jgi:RNA polymerase sigma-70 factor (ECF subfamily)